MDIKKIVNNLLSNKLKVREKALIYARDLAKKGNRNGLDALAEAIKIKGNLPPNYEFYEFYEPRSLAINPPGFQQQAEEELLGLARNNKLLEDPKNTQSLISKLFHFNRALDVMHKISFIGEDQLHNFQLLGTYLQCKSEEIANKIQFEWLNLKEHLSEVQNKISEWRKDNKDDSIYAVQNTPLRKIAYSILVLRVDLFRLLANLRQDC